MDEKQPAQAYVKLLRSRLSEFRFIHSINVAKAAGQLAKEHGANPEKAYLAGLLHDITKEAPEEEQLRLIEESGILLSSVEQKNTKLWHAISGAAYCRRRLGIDDPEILSAIRYHTTGHSGMTRMETILYLADYISEERDFPDVEEMRAAVRSSLEEGLLYAAKYSVCSLAQKERLLDPNTVAVYNEALLAIQEAKK